MFIPLTIMFWLRHYASAAPVYSLESVLSQGQGQSRWSIFSSFALLLIILSKSLISFVRCVALTLFKFMVLMGDNINRFDWVT